MSPTQLALFRPDELPEVAASSLLCQRWNRRQMSWQLANPDERFRSRDFEVKEIFDDTTPKEYILQHHYSGAYPNALRRFGLFYDGEMVGVAVFSLPNNPLVLTNPFPELRAGVESMEFGRLILDDWVPGNAESWFTTRCLEVLYADGVRGVVSFADPAPRTTLDGRVRMVGHVGYIYQACNALYLGRATKRTHWLMPDGTVFAPDALKKIRTHDKGWRYAEQQLVDLGARRRRDDEDPTLYLAEVRVEIGVRSLRHGGNHRYGFPLGRSKRERDQVRIGDQFTIKTPDGKRVIREMAYPKSRDEMRLAA